jgi:hypothetical protein
MKAGCCCIESKTELISGSAPLKKNGRLGFCFASLGWMSDLADRYRVQCTRGQIKPRPGEDRFICCDAEARQTEVDSETAQGRLRRERSFEGFFRRSLLRARDRATRFPLDQLGGDGNELRFLTGIGNAVEDHLDHLLS